MTEDEAAFIPADLYEKNITVYYLIRTEAMKMAIMTFGIIRQFRIIWQIQKRPHKRFYFSVWSLLEPLLDESR